jgi:hypothetical protein
MHLRLLEVGAAIILSGTCAVLTAGDLLSDRVVASPLSPALWLFSTLDPSAT